MSDEATLAAYELYERWNKGKRTFIKLDENPGVQGLVLLGKNAMKEITRLESENSVLRAMLEECQKKLLSERIKDRVKKRMELDDIATPHLRED